jgi:ribosomal protein S18 acetylase RimI-like enzyme
MDVRSLGYRTDLFFPAFDGEIVPCEGYLAIRTPSNPSFYWGNFLLFALPPQEGDFLKWRELFAREIGGPPEVKHQTFGWDSPEGKEGVVEPFLHAGFRLFRGVVLTCAQLEPASNRPAEVSVRALRTDLDWGQAVACQVACREAEFEEEEFRAFRCRQMDRYRKMVDAGRGGWFGAFLGERLVADLGIFHAEGLGRFQSVETHPDFRRRGIAGNLIQVAGRLVAPEHGLHTLVIVAEADSPAARLYESLGFRVTERQLGLEWWPEMGTE